MRVYLITHAHTEQLPGVASDAWRLSPRGHEEAARLAEAPFWEQVDRVVISAEPKTWLTVAGVVEERKLPVWIDSRFDELRRSGWIENYGEQVAKVFAQPDTQIMGWEAARSVQKRALAAIDNLRVRFAGETLALVGHGLCLSLLRAELLGQSHVDFSAWQRLAFGTYACIQLDPPAMIEDFQYNNGRTR